MVAAVIVAPCALVLAAPTAEAAVTGMSVGSFNVLGCVHGQNYTERMGKVARIIAEQMQYAVVGVQEYASSECRSMLIKNLKNDYGDHWESSTITSYYGLNDASLIWDTNIVSMVPDSEVVLDYDTGLELGLDACLGLIGSDCGAHFSKSGSSRQMATSFGRKIRFITNDGVEFVAVSFHFIGNSPNATLRNQEMRLLTELLADETVPVFLFGDSADFPGSALFTTASNAGYEAAWDTAETSVNAQMETFINSVKPLPMDQVFYRNVAAPTFYETYYSCGKVPGCGSDHRPVKAIFPGLGGNLEEFAQTPEPTVSGTAKVGKALKASAKGWDSQAEVSFQWHRSGVPILNANKESYTPVAADQGKTLTVQAHGTASGYHNAATMSKATAKVALGTFGTPPTPKVTGTTRVGSTLTVSAGTWSPKPSSFKYQWYVDGKSQKGATSSKFKLPAEAKGKKVSVKVTAVKAGYKDASKTVEVKKISAGVFSTQPTPKVSGSVKVESTLKVNAGTWSPKPSSLKYQWYVSGKAVKKATSATYKLPASAKGKVVSVKVTAAKAGYTSVSKTVKTVKVAAGVFTKPSTPKITGKAKVGTTLKAGLGTWSPKPSSYKYQWYLNGKKVKGATSSKFKLPKSAKGKRVTVRVAASKSGFKKLYITSGATGKVKK